MKIRKLLIIPICIATCFMLSGCRAKDISRLIRIGSNLKDKVDGSFDKNDDTSNEKEVISLSDRDKKILANLFDCAIIYTNNGVTDFASWVVYQDDVFNFDKSQKSEYGTDAITSELAIEIVYDGLGIKTNKEDFKLNPYGNIDVVGAGGESTEFYVNKVVKIGDNEYSIYANSILYPIEGAHYSGSYEFNVIKNDKSMFGYTVRGVKDCDIEEWIPETITASSTLNSDGNNSYDAKNLMDNDVATAWAEGGDSIGKGEYVLFESSKKEKISGALIDNGYLKSTDLLNKNGAIEKVRFEFSDGSIVERDLNPVLTVDQYIHHDSLYTDYINFGKEIETTFVKMTILDASIGSTYEDTCVSEIKFIR